MQMNISEAKAKLSELIAAAEQGKEVIIARGGYPVAQIVSAAPAQGFRCGLLDGRAAPLPDFFESMPEGEVRLWE